MSRRRLRGLWLRLHRYLGLILGLPLALIGLSGSLIVFGWPLDAWLNRELTRVAVPPDAVARPLAEIVAAAQARLPADAAPLDWLVFPEQADRAFRFNYRLPTSPDSYEIFVDPYTATVVGQRLWGDFAACCSWHGPIMTVIYRFHDSFWLGETGQTLVGGIGLIGLVSVLSGIALWWPNPGKWRAALTAKAGASRQRRVFDLHKLAGSYGFVGFAALLFTGAYMNFPAQSRAIVDRFSPLTAAPDGLHSTPGAGPTLSEDAAVAAARRYFPSGKPATLALPTTPDGVYVIDFFGGDELTPTLAGHSLTIDQYSGALLYRRDPANFSAGDRFHAWQFGLHSGQALGPAGQLLVMACGPVPAILYVTGFIRWRQKRRAHRLANQR